MVDAISDMLTRIRNAQQAKLLSVSMPNSKLRVAVLDVLLQEGYIDSYKVINTVVGGCIEVVLKYSVIGKPIISEIHRVSRPGKRAYMPIYKLKAYYNGMGIYIISTSRGIISDRKARVLGVGGEVLCKVF